MANTNHDKAIGEQLAETIKPEDLCEQDEWNDLLERDKPMHRDPIINRHHFSHQDQCHMIRHEESE